MEVKDPPKSLKERLRERVEGAPAMPVAPAPEPQQPPAPVDGSLKERLKARLQQPPTDPFASAPPAPSVSAGTASPSGGVGHDQELFEASFAVSGHPQQPRQKPFVPVSEAPLPDGAALAPETYEPQDTRPTWLLKPEERLARKIGVDAERTRLLGEKPSDELKLAQTVAADKSLPFAVPDQPQEYQVNTGILSEQTPQGMLSVRTDPREDYIHSAYLDHLKDTDPTTYEKLTTLRSAPKDQWQRQWTEEDGLQLRVAELEHQRKFIEMKLAVAGDVSNLSDEEREDLVQRNAYVNEQFMDLKNRFPKAFAELSGADAAQQAKDLAYQWAKDNWYTPTGAAVIAKEQIARPAMRGLLGIVGNTVKAKNFLEDDAEEYKQTAEALDLMKGARGSYGGASQTSGSPFADGWDFEKIAPAVSEQMANMFVLGSAARAGKLALVATGYAATFGDLFDEAIKNGANYSEAAQVANTGAYLQGVLELVSPIPTGGTSGLAKTALKDIARGGALKSDAARRLAKDILGEVAQENMQDVSTVLTNAAANAMAEKEVTPNDYTFDQFMETTMITALTTGLFHVSAGQQGPLYHNSVLWAVNNPDKFAKAMEGSALSPEEKTTATERVELYKKVLAGHGDAPLTSKRMKVADLQVKEELAKKKQKEAIVSDVVKEATGDPLQEEITKTQDAIRDELGIPRPTTEKQDAATRLKQTIDTNEGKGEDTQAPSDEGGGTEAVRTGSEGEQGRTTGDGTEVDFDKEIADRIEKVRKPRPPRQKIVTERQQVLKDADNLSHEELGADGLAQRYLANGGRVSTESLVRELGLRNTGTGKTGAEMRAKIWAHKRDAPSIEAVAEQLSEGSDLDVNEVRNALIDAIAGSSGRNSLVEALRARTPQSLDDMEREYREQQASDQDHEEVVLDAPPTAEEEAVVDADLLRMTDEEVEAKAREYAEYLTSQSDDQGTTAVQAERQPQQGQGDAAAPTQARQESGDTERQRLYQEIDKAKSELRRAEADINKRGQVLFPESEGSTQTSIEGGFENTPDNYERILRPIRERVASAEKAAADYEAKATERARAAAQQTSIPTSPRLTNLSTEKNKRADELREKIRKKLGGQLSAGIDPELMAMGVEYGALLMENGAKGFAKWSAEMIEAIGDAIAPYLKSIYSAMRYAPGVDTTGMTSDAELSKPTEKATTLAKPDGTKRATTGSAQQTGRQSGRTTAVATERPGASGRPPLRVVDEGRIPRPREIVDAGRYALSDDQRLGVNLALTAFADGKPGFLLADGTGTGKTRQILVIAHEHQKSSGKPSVVITQNKQIIKGSFADDGKALGIGDVKMYTYDDLRNGKVPDLKYGVVLFDEAHNLKNDTSGKSIAASGMEADHKVFATATPMDRPTSAAYFLSEITGRTEASVANELGYEVKNEWDDQKKKFVRMVYPKEDVSWSRILDNMLRLREEAIANGQMVRREYPFYGSISTREVVMDEAFHRDQAEVDQYWQGVIYDAKGQAAKRNAAGQRINELSRLSEAAKVDHIYEAALADVRAGKSVIVIGEGVNTTMIKALGMEVDGLISALKKKFDDAGIGVASVYGSDDNKSDEVEKFQSGKVNVLLATPKSGGTGINLDDTAGDRPRSLHLATINYSGDLIDQMLGRVSRRNTASPADVSMWFGTGVLSDQRRREIAKKKLTALRRIQTGEDPDVVGFNDQDGAQPAPMEQRIADERDMIVQHNLSGENLLNASRIGGLAAPSLAITKVDNPLHSFGEITLLGAPSMADPKGPNKTKVFGADIYSPRYPQITYKIDRKKADALKTAMAPYKDKYDDDRYWDSELLHKGAAGLRNENTVMAMFLDQEGVNVSPVKEGGKVSKWKTHTKLLEAIRKGGAQEKYDQFVDDLFAALGAEEKIFTGFTNMGNRRYVAHNIDNVVRILKKELRAGESFNYGVGSVRATLTPQFRSLDAIRKAKGRLMSEADFEKVKEEAANELFGITDKLRPYYKHDGYRIGFVDTVNAVIMDAAKTGLEKQLNEYGFENVPQEVKTSVREYMSKLANMPTEYFEAKIVRAVQLQEFSAAAIPSNTPQRVRDILNKHGIATVEYDRNKAGDRQRAVKQAATEGGLLFQRGAGGASSSRTTVKAATKILKSIVPDLKITEHTDAASYKKAVDKAWARAYGAKAREGIFGDGGKAFFDPATGEIHLSPDASDTSLAHEAIHPLLEAVVRDNPELLTDLYEQLAKDPALKEYVDFGELYAEQGDEVVAKEAVTQFLAAVAEGKFDGVYAEKPSFRRMVKDFLRKLLDALGIKRDRVDFGNIKDLKAFAGLVADAFRTGAEAKVDGAASAATVAMQQDADRVIDGWYSRLDDAVAVKGNTQSGTDWMRWAEARAKEGALSMEEVKWTGLADFLKGKAKVTPKEVRDFLKDNRVEVEVKVLSDAKPTESDYRKRADEIARSMVLADGRPNVFDKERGRTTVESVLPFVDYDHAYTTAREELDSEYEAQDNTKFGQWQVHGGTNYREVAIVLVSDADIKPDMSGFSSKKRADGEWIIVRPNGSEMLTTHDPSEEVAWKNARETIGAIKSANAVVGGQIYKVPQEHSMGDDADVNRILHLRLNDRTIDVPFTAEESAAIDERNRLDTERKKLDASIIAAKRRLDESRKPEEKRIHDEVMEEVKAGRMRLGDAKQAILDRQLELSDSDSKELRHYRRLLQEREAITKKMPAEPRKRQEKVLFIEELQSDWGQQGKKEGFKRDPGLTVEEQELQALIDKSWLPAKLTSIEKARLAELNAAVGDSHYAKRTAEGKIPPAPFVTSTDAWVELGMKQAIRMAVEGGYDRIAWTTGEQQNERYDLSKQVDRIAWMDPRGRYANPQGIRSVTIEVPSGRDIDVIVGEDGNVISATEGDLSGKRLDEVVGKDLAAKIMGERSGDLSGDGLKIGGAGMKGFYDKILPTVAKKVSRKMGGDGAVSEMRLNTIDMAKEGMLPYMGMYETFDPATGEQNGGPFDSTEEAARLNPGHPTRRIGMAGQPSIAITPAMRARVRAGTPLMQRAPMEERRAKDDPANENRDTSTRAAAETAADMLDGHKTYEDFIAATQRYPMPWMRRLWNRIHHPTAAAGIPVPLNVTDIAAIRMYGELLEVTDPLASTSYPQLLKRMEALTGVLDPDIIAEKDPATRKAMLKAQAAFQDLYESVRGLERLSTEATPDGALTAARDILTGEETKHSVLQRGSFEMAERLNIVRAFQRNFQDTHVAQQMVEAQIEKNNAKIPDEQRAYVLHELYVGKLKDQYEKAVDYLFGSSKGSFAKGKKLGLFGTNETQRNAFFARLSRALGGGRNAEGTQRLFDKYLTALHAPERNARVRAMRGTAIAQEVDDLQQKIAAKDPKDPNNKSVLSRYRNQIKALEDEAKALPQYNGSGMSDADAAAILKAFDKAGHTQVLSEYEAEFRENVITPIIDMLADAGMLTEEGAADLRGGTSKTGVEWKHYVPLKMSQSALIDAHIIDGAENYGVGIPVKRLVGSERGAADRTSPSLQAIYDLFSAMKAVQRNEVNKGLYELAKAHPNPDVWEIVPARTEVITDKAGNVVSVVDHTPDEVKNNGVKVKIDGKTEYIHLINEPLREAWKRERGKSDVFVDTFLGALRLGSNIFRSMLTTLDPGFAIPNVTRDIQDAITNATSEDVKGFAKALVKKIPAAMPAILRYRKGYDGNRKMDRYIREMFANGGAVTWLDHSRMDEHMADLSKMVDRAASDKALDFTEGLSRLPVIEHIALLNDVLEMSTRVAAYAAARDKGATPQQAAHISKNITVNFNRRGMQTGWTNLLWMFSNAGIQASVGQLLRLRKPHYARAVGKVILLGILLQGLRRWLQDDDEEEQQKLLVTAQDTENMYVSPIRTKSGGNVSIPLSYGLPGTAFKLGNIIYDVAAGHMDVAEGAASAGSRLMKIIDPIGNGSPNTLSAWTPYGFKWVTETEMNKKWNNTPIYKERNYYQKDIPDYENYFKKTNPLFVEWAKSMYENSDGKVDVSPQTFQYIADEVVSGLVKTGMNTLEVMSNDKDDIAAKIPVVRRFVFDPASDEWRVIRAMNTTWARSDVDALTDAEKAAHKKMVEKAFADGLIDRDEKRRLLKLGKGKAVQQTVE